MHKGKAVLASFKQHQDQRIIIEDYWEDAFRYTLPHRGQSFLGNGDNGQNGYTDVLSARNDEALIFDSTAIDAVRLLASSIISGLTPTNSQWFTLGIQNMSINDIPYDGAAWLQDAGKNLFKMIHTSNYNATAFEFFQDIAIAGQCGLFVDKDQGGDFNFEVWPLGTLWVSETLRRGTIDTVYRSFSLTIPEAIEMFGKEKLSPEMTDAYRTNPANLRMYEYIHCIKPRIINSKQADGELTADMPWESIYVIVQGAEVVKESGYMEFPVVIPRWSAIPNTAYALGPLNDCLPDVKTLNKTIEMMLLNTEMAIAGTYVAKHDGILNPTTIKIGPRRVVFAADVKNIQPLTTASNFSIAYEEIRRMQDNIKSIMMASDLEPMQKNYASATEVTVRSQIIRQILGPVFARLQSEYLEPLLARCFGLALRDGTLGQPPESIIGAPISTEYQSPMARAQKMEDISSMDQFEEKLAQFSQIDQGILDLYDADAAYRRRAELLGVPVTVIRSKEQVTLTRETQALAQAEALEAAESHE